MSVSLFERQSVFGATSLSQMTRGNKVPNGPPANASVPNALPLALSQLAGAVNSSGLTVATSPTTANGSHSTTGAGATNSVTATASGGSGSGYTYLWVVTTTSGPTISAVSGTSATTAFTSTLTGPSPESIGTAYCKVTDSASNTANGPIVSIDNSYSP